MDKCAGTWLRGAASGAAIAVLAMAPQAHAQSGVTITGMFKLSLENIRLADSAKTPSSENRMADDFSRLYFNVTEDLGGGLRAIGQYELRLKFDDAGSPPAALTAAQNTGGNLAAGNSHVGLVSKQWGRLAFGRQDLHYLGRESNLSANGSLRADSISLLAFAGGGGQAIAATQRTQNVIHYTSPDWGGFTLVAAHSTNPFAADADIGSGVRKGSGWNLNPTFKGRNFQLGYSYWKARQDAGAATIATGDQRSDRLYGSVKFAGLSVGLAWDRSRISAVGAGGDLSRRSAWSLPVEYRWNRHGLYAHYTRARDDSVVAGDNGARMFALAYAYELSRRTALALTYARISNAPAAAYNFFTSTSLGGASATVAAGEDPRLLAATLRHSF